MQTQDDDIMGKAYDARLMRRLLSLVRPYRWMAVVSVILLTNHLAPNSESLKLTSIVDAQQSVWFALVNPLGFLIFFVCALAETNRAPFDLAEAEQELVAGFHTEYSGMKFGAFFVAEYLNVIISSSIISTLFLGGFHGPFETLLGVSSWGTIGILGWSLA